ncbi:MAG: HEAT repeat domain-containing protein [Bacteroidota bacterium]
MNCAEFNEKIIDYLEDALDEKEKHSIEKHLETCDQCLDELREIREIMQLMDNSRQSEPGETLRINFYRMLYDEIMRASGTVQKVPPEYTERWYTRGSFRVAAGVALLVTGILTGMIINSLTDRYNRQMLTEMQSELTAMKKTALFTMLRDESSSSRIQAVNYADDIDTPDENLIEVLVKTLNNDKNVNVRMAAAYALEKYADQRSVSDSLVTSLSYQSDPILQVTLINILVGRGEKSAYDPINRLIKNENTNEQVRKIAQNGIKQLI